MTEAAKLGVKPKVSISQACISSLESSEGGCGADWTSPRGRYIRCRPRRSTAPADGYLVVVSGFMVLLRSFVDADVLDATLRG